MDSTKQPWQSKTLWINLIIAIAAFIPAVQTLIAANPESFALLITGITTGLRLVSKDKISIS